MAQKKNFFLRFIKKDNLAHKNAMFGLIGRCRKLISESSTLTLVETPKIFSFAQWQTNAKIITIANTAGLCNIKTIKNNIKSLIYLKIILRFHTKQQKR